MESSFEVIDAFVDGERVNPAELKRALTDEAGREYLVDAWLLRECVQDEIALDPKVLIPARTARPRIGLLLAAAGAFICLAGGYATGYRMAARVAPAAPQVVTLPAVIETNPKGAPFPAPAPTRVIRLEPGVDWNERSGGD